MINNKATSFITSIMSGDLDLNGFTKFYNQMSENEKQEFQNMANSFLAPIISRAFRITMKESEGFRTWLGEQIQAKTQANADIDDEQY